MLLMSGRLDRAFNEGRSEKSIGWCYGKAGVLFASVLSVLAQNSGKAVNISALLKQYANRSSHYDDDNDSGSKTGGAFRRILIGLMSVEIRDAEARKYAAWADKIGRARIEAIVSGQHRGAYDRAARVLGALLNIAFLQMKQKKHGHFCMNSSSSNFQDIMPFVERQKILRPVHP